MFLKRDGSSAGISIYLVLINVSSFASAFLTLVLLSIIIYKMFMIVTREHDFPVFELELQQQLLRSTQGTAGSSIFQFVLNAALDPVDMLQW